MIRTPVDDDEDVYRGVKPLPIYYKRLDNGEIQLSRSAFNDPQLRPSVDRARLCDHDPAWTQKGDSNCGVVSLRTQNVRLIGSVTTNDAKGPIMAHTVDVVHEPEVGNEAHAVIATLPQVDKDNAFKRLQLALTKIACWEILPTEESLGQGT